MSGVGNRDPVVWPTRPLRSPGALLKLGYRCNNGCVFCHSAPHRGLDLSTEQALAHIDLAARAGVERIVLSGGEPTIRPDLVRLIAAIGERGLLAGIVTNGRMLAYARMQDALAEAGLGQVYLSLHSHRAAVHDALVRVAGAHAQALRALDWLVSQPRLSLRVNAVITRPNLGDLAGLARLVAARVVAARSAAVGPREPVRLTFSFVEPEGNALDDFEALVPSLQEAARAVARVCSASSDASREDGVELFADGFPPCVLPAHRVARSDLWTEGFVYLMEAFERELHPIDEAHKRRGAVCRVCSVDGCPGVYATYLDRRGEDALVPLHEPRGSSVDFVAQGSVERFDPTACPARSGDAPHPDVRREVLVSRGRGAVLHRAEAEDFPEQTLAEIVREQGQLYRPLDAGEQAVDFSVSLQKLEPAAACVTCPQQGACGRVWVDANGDVLARDEGEVRERVGACRGRVLDVGCGAARYADALAPWVAAGLVELHLLDPDPGALGAAGDRGLAHRLHQVAVEDARPDRLGLEPASFDHILSIRSYSHFEDVDRAARVLAQLLAPSGRLTVVGDTAVALARSPAAVGLAHALGKRPEHWRNHGPSRARLAFEAAGLEVVSMRPVAPASANLWWLVMRRTDGERSAG